MLQKVQTRRRAEQQKNEAMTWSTAGEHQGDDGDEDGSSSDSEPDDGEDDLSNRDISCGSDAAVSKAEAPGDAPADRNILTRHLPLQPVRSTTPSIASWHQELQPVMQLHVRGKLIAGAMSSNMDLSLIHTDYLAVIRDTCIVCTPALLWIITALEPI